jgi:hypothetical protein
MKSLRLLFFFLGASAVFAQAPSATFHGNGAPSLPCGSAQLYQQDNASPQALWYCVAPSNTASTANWAQLGASGSTNATQIQGNAVKSGTPTSGQVYAWNSTNSDFELSSSGGGGASLSATNQSWTGAGSLTLTNGAMVLPIGVNAPMATGATAGGGSKFQLNFDPQTYIGSDATIVDVQMSLGYNRCMNGTTCIGTEPAWFMGWEDDYVVPGQSKNDHLFNEWYMQFQPTANGATRPIFVQVHRDAGCITAGNCDINDFELNSDPAIGIGFHTWANNSIQWANMNGTGLSMLGYAAQASDTVLLARGQNGKYGALTLDNSSTGKGFDIASVSDNADIWQLNMPNLDNWMQYNTTKTSIGGSGTFPGNATVSIVPPSSSTNVVLSLGLNSSNTADLLRFYGNTGSQLGQVSSAGKLSLPTLAVTGITGSTQCLQADTSGNLSGTGSACGSGSSAVSSVANSDSTLTVSPTTGSVVASLNLANPNVWTAPSAASQAGVKYTGTCFTGGSGTTTFPYILIDQGATPVTTWSTGGTCGIGLNAPSGETGPILDAHINGGASVFQLRYDGSFIAASAQINTHGNATFGGAGDNAGTGQAIYAVGSVRTTNELDFGSNKSRVSAPTDGQILLTNNATTGFNTLYFGAKTSSFPALNVSSTTLQAILGDNSGDTSFEAKNFNPVSPVTNETGSSGSCNFSMPFQGTTYKKVVITCSGLNGTTASFTFPVAFTNTPGSYIASNASSLSVGSVSTTAVTITGTGSSVGVVVLEGN